MWRKSTAAEYSPKLVIVLPACSLLFLVSFMDFMSAFLAYKADFVCWCAVFLVPVPNCC